MTMQKTGVQAARTQRYNHLVCVVLFLVLMAVIPAVVCAAHVEEGLVVVSFEQQDLDNDGDPDVAIILAEYMGKRFKVVVYDQGRDMQWSNDWQTGTDFYNDLWLFQTETADQTKLIIRFSHGPEGYIAELYDDFDGDQDVSYKVHSGTEVDIFESSYPTLRVTAEQPWLLPGGRVNYMVRCTTYRPWSIPFMPATGVSYLPQNGIPTYVHEVVDSAGNGIPDYELRRALPDLPPGSRLFRSALNVNVSQTSLPDFENTFFWPYLGYADPEHWRTGAMARGVGDLTPPLQVDWQHGVLKGIGEFLPTHSLGNQWVFLSTKPIEKDRANELDWEVFAYYDFTGDMAMDVLFRMIYQPGWPVRIGSRDLHLQQVSYAWNHQNRGTIKWDYELKMARLHEFPSSVVQFEDFALYTVPYEDLLDHFSRPSDWAYATFIAAESNAYPSSEGMLEWRTLEGIVTDVSAPMEERTVPRAFAAQRDYLRGWRDSSPADLYTEIREGFRGEYADLLGPARLYFSTIDRRLHLLGAQKGVWNLGKDRQIQYANLGGAYLDTWTLLEGDKPTRTLYAPPGYLLYQGPDEVQLYQADGSAALFTTIPPRNQDAWVELDEELAQHQPAFAPDDFWAMAQQSGEELSMIANASLRDLRLTEEGFRFVLKLEGTHAPVGRDPLGPDTLAAGEYVVAVSGEGFSVQPLTAAQVTLALEVDSGDGSLKTLRVRLTNEGLADLVGIHPSLVQICDEDPQALEGPVLDLYGKESRTVSVRLPLANGKACVVEAQVLGGDGTVLATGRIEVLPDSLVGLASQLVQYSAGGFPEVAFLLLCFLTALIGTLGRASLRKEAN
jgi:hypothetical protein